jgi:hypothetical protein
LTRLWLALTRHTRAPTAHILQSKLWLPRCAAPLNARRRMLAAAGHVPAASTVRTHIQPAVPLATSFNASALPTTLGAYAGKVEDRAEKRGSKVQRSLSDLLGLGFRLITWDGLCVLTGFAYLCSR